ncbi:hypothetical protein F5Y15DRAFT_171692 [Xylariaceae sp. FL0016]|nr:hypothetical protein F5Y15DRAFT_171692 [Xylariaceae sp. FL0016]
MADMNMVEKDVTTSSGSGGLGETSSSHSVYTLSPPGTRTHLAISAKRNSKSSPTKEKKSKSKTKPKKGAVAPIAGSPTSEGIKISHHEHIVDSKTKKLPRKQKIRRHCAIFWLWYLVGAIVLLAIGLPILFLVIVPALAQLIVNKTSLPIYGGSIQAISNDALIIGLSTALSVPAGLKVDLAPLDLFLYNKATPKFSPFFTVPLPEQHISGHTEISISNETIGIGNRSELDAWLTTALNDATALVSVKGNTTAHLGALKAHIKLDKTVEIPALRKLTGVSIVDSRIALPAAADGSNLVGNMTLPNYSELTLGLGNVTFNVWTGDLLIGSAAIDNVHAPPGNSTMPFRGEIFLDTVVSHIFDVFSSQAQYLAEGKLGLALNGNTTIVDGQHIEYLESVLNAASLFAEVTVTQLFIDAFNSILDGNLTLPGLGGAIGGGGNEARSPYPAWLSQLNLTQSVLDDFDDGVKRLRNSPIREKLKNL